jgi:hypothetical protein
MRALSIYASGTNASTEHILYKAPLEISIFKFYFLPQNRPPEKTLCCKSHENPRDRKSQTWAPLVKDL